MPDVVTDLRIHYRVVGDGPPVLWHTGGCGDGSMWELAGYVDRLPGCTHVLMDHRGRGHSDAPADLAGHDMARYVADALAVLDDVGADRAAFVGYSFGARVGFAVAQAAPARLAGGLVALDSFPDPGASPERLRAEAQEVLTRGTREIIEEFVRAEREPVPGWLVEHLCTTDSLAFAGAIEAEATEPDLWSAASSVDVPVLLVLGVGADDPATELGRRLVGALPDAELVTLEVAHLAAFHRVDLTVPLIGRFLHVSS